MRVGLGTDRKANDIGQESHDRRVHEDALETRVVRIAGLPLNIGWEAVEEPGRLTYAENELKGQMSVIMPPIKCQLTSSSSTMRRRSSPSSLVWNRADEMATPPT